MASLKISCPHCDQTVKVAESAEGKKIRCPNCDKPFIAQVQDDDAPSAKRSPKQAKSKSADADDDRPRRKPTRDDDDDSEDDRPRRKKSTRADDDNDPDDDRPRKKKSKPGMSPMLMGLLGVLGLVAVVAGVVFGYPALTRGPEIAKGPPPQQFPPGMPPGMQPPPFNGGGNGNGGGGDENPPLPKNPEVIPARFNIQLPPAHLRPLLVTDPGGHTSTVQKVLVTPDKTQVVTVSMDKTVRIWDIASGETVRTLRLPMGVGNEGSLLACAITSDGKRLAVGGFPLGLGKHGFPIHIISLESGEIEKSLRGHTNTILDLAFTKDGRHLVSGSGDTTAILFDVATGQPLKVMRAHRGPVRSIVLSPDEKRLATLSTADNTVRLWTLPDGAPVGVLDKFPEQVFSVAWNPVTSEIATGGDDGTLHI